MKHSAIGKMGALLLITGAAFAVPSYAANTTTEPMVKSAHEHDHKHDATAMPGNKNEAGARQMSGVMMGMSTEMKDMSGMVEHGNMSPATMKKMSTQMKQMGDMMHNMSDMMHKNMKMDAGMQKKVGEMQKQMEKMNKDMPATSANM